MKLRLFFCLILVLGVRCMKKGFLLGNQNKKSFKCHICYENRFVSLIPSCKHTLCGICYDKILSHQNLKDVCTICRAEYSKIFEDYRFDFHKFDDLKAEEHIHAVFGAISEGKLPLLKRLLNHGFDFKKAGNCGNLAFYAAAKGNLDIFKFLASQGANIYKLGCHNETAIQAAAINGHFEIVKFLATQGADINQVGASGETLLHVAAFTGHYELAKFLVEQGVDVDKKDNKGSTAAAYIAAHVNPSASHIEVANYLENLRFKKQRQKKLNQNHFEPLINYFPPTIFSIEVAEQFVNPFDSHKLSLTFKKQ